MKTVEFGEEQLADISSIAQQLFADENDPTSTAYKRVLNRPKINWLKAAVLFLLPFAAAGAALYLCLRFSSLGGWSYAVAAAVFLGVFMLAGKGIAVKAVRIYQRFAPAAIRNKCRFEPSCSEYMILSLEKYGFFKGLAKGIGRLKRCNIDHGGYDYP